MSFDNATINRRMIGARGWALAAVSIVLLAVVLLVSSAVAAKPGTLDRSFGGDGLAQLAQDTELFGAAAQRDGKLVATGVQKKGSQPAKLLLVRFKPNGGLDRKFSGDGMLLGPSGSVGHDVAIQPDGRIVVGGALTDASGQLSAGMLVMRFKAGGGPDRSFSGDGKATAFTDQRGQALGVALDGTKIVAAGSARGDDGYERVALARFKSGGGADNSFGTKGQALLDFGRLSFANDVAVQSNHRVVVAGSQRNNLQTTNVLAARVTAAGKPDGSFGGNAGLPGLFVNQYAQGAGYSAAFGIALVSGGKVVLGGTALTAAEGANAIAVRLTGGGKPDRSFSGDSVAYLPASQDHDQYNHEEPMPGAAAVVRSGSDVLLGGYFDALTTKQLAVWALRSNGSLDSRFGQGGRTVTPITDSSGELSDLVLIPRGGDLYGVGEIGNFFNPTQGLTGRYAGLSG